MKRLEGLRWVPRWVSHMGCIKGCLDYLGIGVTDAWLFGATGHAFVINIGERLCPSGPTAWSTERIFALGRNIGYGNDVVFGMGMDDEARAAKQQEAWDFVRAAIDQGLPCYGWELDIPEFYVIQGYDDTGYYYSGAGCDEGMGPKPWQTLGNTEIGIIEIYRLAPGRPADDATTVREALAFALEHAQGPAKWVFPGYRSGMAGFDRWIEAHEQNTADGFGTAYNAAVWSECRGYAVRFLEEARQRLDGRVAGALDRAIADYRSVAECLEAVAGAFPFEGLQPEHIHDPARVDTALRSLRAASDAEAAGLEALQQIVDALA
jgi:hypothetical protein